MNSLVLRRKKNINAISFKRKLIANIVLFILVLLVFIIGCNVGQYKMDFITIIKTLFGFGDKYSNLVMF